jgi:hypothetical protein
MWKIVTVLVLTALAIFAARLAHDAPLADFQHTGSIALEASAPATATPPLMYAGIRG